MPEMEERMDEVERQIEFLKNQRKVAQQHDEQQVDLHKDSRQLMMDIKNEILAQVKALDERVAELEAPKT